MKLKKGDTVVVLAGKDKGRQGEILRVYPKKNKVLVKGINMFKRHVAPRQGIEGGILDIERPLDASKVAYYDAKAKRAVRLGYKVEADGTKIRIAKQTGNQVDKQTTKAKKTAKKSKSKTSEKKKQTKK